ncbi:MAG TPA: TonB family protein [Longimicrobium sp.]|nr:TonB family protein [Longimicrobium sp.]
MISRRILLPTLAALLPVALHAQTPPAAVPRVERPQQCRTVPDTARAPTPQQIAEANRLRDDIRYTFRQLGVERPHGILMVDVDSTRQGKLLFLNIDVPQPAIDAGLALVREYLAALPGGKPYQALIRIDGEYPAITPGRRHCLPDLANSDSLYAWRNRVALRHPEFGRGTGGSKQATVLLVVNRLGEVHYVQVLRPTGDAFLDANVEHIARRLRFRPATLDGQPFDVRYRFTLNFDLQ